MSPLLRISPHLRVKTDSTAIKSDFNNYLLYSLTSISFSHVPYPLKVKLYHVRRRSEQPITEEDETTSEYNGASCKLDPWPQLFDCPKFPFHY